MASRRPIWRLLLPLLPLLLPVWLTADLVAAEGVWLMPDRTEHVLSAGQSLYVSCKTRHGVGMVWYGPMQTEIRRLKSGQVYVEPSVGADSGTTGIDVVLHPVKRKNRGKYTCRASINGIPHEASFMLIVNKPIEFNENQLKQFASEGSDFTVRCDVSGEPKPGVHWRRPIGRLDLGPTSKFDIDPVSSGLVIRNVTRTDEGTYLCKATQVNSKASDTRTVRIQLKVQYKPEWAGRARSETYGYLRGSANLTCHAHAEPPPKFVWYKDDQLLGQQPQYRLVSNDSESVLMILSISEDMFGEFQCRAQNQVGIFDQMVTLKKGQKPDIPTVRVTDTGSTQLTLDISTPPQEMPANEYRAQYRRHDSQWPLANTAHFKPGDPYVINNLQPGTAYMIRVASRNEAGYGDFSETLQHTTDQQVVTGTAPTSSSRPLVLELLSALIMAALLVL